MIKFSLPRLDKDKQLNELLMPYCRFREGDVWKDPQNKHTVACLSVDEQEKIRNLAGNIKASLAIHDPPYNLIAFKKSAPEKFIDWCSGWVDLTYSLLKNNSAFYIWLGADQTSHFEPFARFIIMMEKSGFDSRSFITMRNQRGYGTQKNWMAVRQELLYYVKGSPLFNIESVYTDIPKVLKGYYKEVRGKLTENIERSKSEYIRAGNVWIDIQQVFHLMEENVSGCYAQKPLKAIERIINVSSYEGDLVLDFFAHAGTTLLAAEKLKRNCFTIDINPLYCEISVRRLENFRKFGKTGWQTSNPFFMEIMEDKKLQDYLLEKYNIITPNEESGTE